MSENIIIANPNKKEDLMSLISEEPDQLFRIDGQQINCLPSSKQDNSISNSDEVINN